MNTVEALEALRAKFFEGLKAKTGWGYLEIQKLYNDSEREILLKLAQQTEKS